MTSQEKLQLMLDRAKHENGLLQAKIMSKDELITQLTREMKGKVDELAGAYDEVDRLQKVIAVA